MDVLAESDETEAACGSTEEVGAADGADSAAVDDFVEGAGCDGFKPTDDELEDEDEEETADFR